MFGVCLECGEHIELVDDAEVEDFVVCPKCRVRYEVIDLDPVQLDYVATPTDA
jgi:lysine biosynthesis protein LysW